MARVFCVGHAVQDFVFSVSQLPDRGAKYRAHRFESVGGGPAATAAVAIARLGGEAFLAARVGADSIAEILVAELESYGVDCRYVRRFADCASSVSSVMIDGKGERMIVNHLDSQMPREAQWLPDARSLAADAVLGDARWSEGAAAALAQARAAGLPAVLDADKPVPKDGTMLAAATHIVFSAEGLADYMGDRDPGRALLQVAENFDAWCCVTVGAEGCYSVNDGVLEHHAAHRVAVVDTLGAGDVWHGAFTLALAEDRGERAAVAFASGAAALKVQRFGGRAGAPTRTELDGFLAAQGAGPGT
jgi:sulfofructose kinase